MTKKLWAGIGLIVAINGAAIYVNYHNWSKANTKIAELEASRAQADQSKAVAANLTEWEKSRERIHKDWENLYH